MSKSDRHPDKSSGANLTGEALKTRSYHLFFLSVKKKCKNYPQ
jgi:hypothetical protein